MAATFTIQAERDRIKPLLLEALAKCVGPATLRYLVSQIYGEPYRIRHYEFVREAMRQLYEWGQVTRDESHRGSGRAYLYELRRPK